MEVKEGYKKTEIGIIPDEWEVKKLGEFGEISTGNTPPTNDASNYGFDYFFVSPADLGKGKWILDTEKKLSKKGFAISRKFPKNSILFTCIGSTIGKSGLAPKELTSNQQINAVFPNESFVTDYLFYCLTLLAPKIKAQASEQAVPIINKSEFGNTPIPLPPLPEQKAIAEVLSDTDNLIQTLEKRIAKKRLIKQGAMQKLLKPKEDWEVKKLGEIGKTYGGLSGKSKKDFDNGKYPYIPFMNIMSNPVIDTTYLDYVNIEIGESQNQALKDELFFNGSSETPEEVGMCSILLKDIPNLYLNSFCFGFRLKKELKTDGLYLSYFFRSSEGRKVFYSMAQGATRYNLSKSNFLKIEIPYPPITEQTRIATILSDMDAEIEALEKKLAKYKQLKQGLMQNLLTGKMRLI